MIQYESFMFWKKKKAFTCFAEEIESQLYYTLKRLDKRLYLLINILKR